MIPTTAGLTSTLLLTAAVVCSLLALTVVARRVTRTYSTRREERRRARVRPLVIDVLDGQTGFTLSKRDRATLVALAAEMAGQVRGDDRSALTDWLTEQQFHRACLKKMKSPFVLTRARALSRFGPMAHLAPRSIEQMLADKDPRVRSLAAQIAGLSGSAMLVPPLLRSIEGSRKIPARIVSMAVLRTAPTSISYFGDTITHGDDSVRTLAIDLAGQLNLVDARKVIEAGLESHNAAVRGASIRSLQRLGSPLSLPALERMRPQTTVEIWSVQDAMRELVEG